MQCERGSAARVPPGGDARVCMAQIGPLAPARRGASPGLLCRRYSVPETIMRKYRLAQQTSDTDETAPGTSRSPASTSAGESPQRLARRDREEMRRSALLRRLWGRAEPAADCACCGATRSLDGSRAELRPLSRRAAPARGGSGRAAESYCTFRSHERAPSSWADGPTDILTDTEGSKPAEVGDRLFAAGSSDVHPSDAATVEICCAGADRPPPASEESPPHVDEPSFTGPSDAYSTSPSTAMQSNGGCGPARLWDRTSRTSHLDGHICERSISVENDERSALPYDKPLSVETPSYELLEIVVSETLDASAIPAITTQSPDEGVASPRSLKAPLLNYRSVRNINIDEYVSNILVESLNSLTDQLECMNASIGGDRKISIVEKEIKVKLQNTGVNTIVHLSPTSNNQIIFGNEELCNDGGRGDRFEETRDSRRALSIRDERALSAESGGDAPSADRPRPRPGDNFDIQHDHVNKAVLQQIQKLFQDELQNLDSDIGYRGEVMPEISHVEISNVDVFIDNNSDPSQAPVASLQLQARRGAAPIGGVRAGNYGAGVVPRFSALPHSDSMEVHASSSEDAELVASDCTSLVDSLDDPSSPRSILLRRPYNNRRNELVRSAIDVLDLLPENVHNDENGRPKDKGESFFIKMADDVCDCDKENVRVSDRMPEKIKQRLYRRHRKRELRMESARRGRVRQMKRDVERQRHDEAYRSKKEAERECIAIVNALIDDVIAKIAQDEYKCMRIKRRPSNMVGSKSDENVAKRSWRKESQPVDRKDFHKHSKKEIVRFETADAEKDRYRTENHQIRGKLSLLTHPSQAPEERGPKRIYQKSEFHEGNKCIEILEILEYVNGSPSSPDTTTSDENQNQRTKKSRIPVPVHDKVQKNNNNNSYRSHGGERSPPKDRDANANRLLADALLRALAGAERSPPRADAERSPPRAGDERSPPRAAPRSRSNSLRFKQTFDIIPEERSSHSLESGAEDVNHNRRASAPEVIDELGEKPPDRGNIRESGRLLTPDAAKRRVTRSAGTSPMSDGADECAPGTRNRTTMTSPGSRSAATSPAPAPRCAWPRPPRGWSAATSPAPAPRCAWPRPPRGARREGSKVKAAEQARERRSANTQGDEAAAEARRRRERPRRDTRAGRARLLADSRHPHSTQSPERDHIPPEAHRGDRGTFPDSFREDVFESMDKQKSISPDGCGKEPVHSLPEFKRGGSEAGSSSSESGGSLLCSLAPKWLSQARHRRAARRRDPAPPATYMPPAPLTPRASPPYADKKSATGAGGWSVTVAGSCRAALPADVEMRLRFPPCQECSCAHCASCACSERGPAPPPARPAPPPALPPAHARLARTDSSKLTLTMKKEAHDSSILASKSRKQSSEALPELETFRASRTKLKSSVKTQRGYSLHCWLPASEPAPIRERDGLSVLGCAIIPELKPRVPTMSERDLTRVYTPRHYLRS